MNKISLLVNRLYKTQLSRPEKCSGVLRNARLEILGASSFSVHLGDVSALTALGVHVERVDSIAESPLRILLGFTNNSLCPGFCPVLW